MTLYRNVRNVLVYLSSLILMYIRRYITSISAEKLRVLNTLSDEELYSKVLSFMEENYSTLKTDDYDTFIKATYLRVNTLNDITKMFIGQMEPHISHNIGLLLVHLGTQCM